VALHPPVKPLLLAPCQCRRATSPLATIADLYTSLQPRSADLILSAPRRAASRGAGIRTAYTDAEQGRVGTLLLKRYTKAPRRIKLFYRIER
jgi:hypothetical protein